jgi:hypothetical protein
VPCPPLALINSTVVVRSHGAAFGEMVSRQNAGSAAICAPVIGYKSFGWALQTEGAVANAGKHC